MDTKQPTLFKNLEYVVVSDVTTICNRSKLDVYIVLWRAGPLGEGKKVNGRSWLTYGKDVFMVRKDAPGTPQLVSATTDFYHPASLRNMKLPSNIYLHGTNS